MSQLYQLLAMCDFEKVTCPSEPLFLKWVWTSTAPCGSHRLHGATEHFRRGGLTVSCCKCKMHAGFNSDWRHHWEGEFPRPSEAWNRGPNVPGRPLWKAGFLLTTILTGSQMSGRPEGCCRWQPRGAGASPCSWHACGMAWREHFIFLLGPGPRMPLWGQWGIGCANRSF